MSASTSTDQAPESWDGTQLLDALTTSARLLEQNVDSLNALNVFPVPDGDTGTNMALTLNGVVRDVAPDPSASVVAERVGYWALMHGRGNSGIILSQILRGVGQALSGHHRLGPREMAEALTHASTTAYQAILKPVEGTMLTVIREASHAAAGVMNAGHTSLEAVLEAAVRGARAAVARTPTLLKSLRDAGVVDAGGQGLLIVLEGLLRYARREPLDLQMQFTKAPVQTPQFDSLHGPDAYGYCTNFVILHSNQPFETVRSQLATLGESLVAVGDEQLIKVHIHTRAPGNVLSIALQYGVIDRVEIANMDLQSAEKRTADGARPAPPHPVPEQMVGAIGVVAVAPGEGFAALLHSMGAVVLSGGAGANPSAGDLLAVLERMPQQQRLILPNDPNIIAAAKVAAAQSSYPTMVVETRSIPQGIAAMLRLQPDGELEQTRLTMLAAAHDVRTLAVTTAVRNAVADGVNVKAGQIIGLLEGRVLVAGKDVQAVIAELLEHVDADQADLLTIYTGAMVADSDAEGLAFWISERYNDLTVEIHKGGQPLYNYILSVE